ncbi:MAG: HEPN domain-containing protein [Promethearchaeati archaeon SRVP18_Atabeyarchaeia-1]
MKRPAKDESIRWLTQAEDEFVDADDLRKRGRFYLALFHFQQAAEKAVKAYLYLKTKSIEVFYTESLDDLLKMAVEADKSFARIEQAKKLDRYYFPTRYPSGLPGGVPSRYFDDPKEAEEAMLLAKEVIDLVKKELKER